MGSFCGRVHLAAFPLFFSLSFIHKILVASFTEKAGKDLKDLTDRMKAAQKVVLIMLRRCGKGMRTAQCAHSSAPCILQTAHSALIPWYHALLHPRDPATRCKACFDRGDQCGAFLFWILRMA